MTVDEVMQLEGYDAAPVVSPRPVPVRAGAGAARRLVGDRRRRGSSAHRVQPQPWDLGPVEVRAGAGVLGVFDAGVGCAGALLASVEAGISDVSAWVPYDWSRTVVVYALSDPTFLASLEDVPGDDPGDLDAVVRSRPAGAGTRFVLNPRMVDQPARPATGWSATSSPTSPSATATTPPRSGSEGLAEWVSVRPLPPEERRLLRASPSRPPRRASTDLPDDDVVQRRGLRGALRVCLVGVRVRRRLLRRGRRRGCCSTRWPAGRRPRRGAARPVRPSTGTWPSRPTG